MRLHLHEGRRLAMLPGPIMKISQRHGRIAMAYRGSELEMILGQGLTSAPRVSMFVTAWRFICRLGASLEAITLFPVTALIVMPLFLYRLATRGYSVLFAPKRDADKS